MKNWLSRSYTISSLGLLIAVAFVLTAFGNIAFFSNLLGAYPLTAANAGFLAAAVLLLYGVNLLILLLVCHRRSIKPIVITLLLLSSLAAYFADTYNTIIDDSMIRNALQTDVAESLDLLSPKLLLYVLLLGGLPSYLVYRARIVFQPGWREIFTRMKVSGAVLAGIIGLIIVFSDFSSSFFREHKHLRYYANPGSYINAVAKLAAGHFHPKAHALHAIGTDAHIPEWDTHRELIVLVVGETARADHFSLNGYRRNTNPLLQGEAVTSFTNFWSCGTSTAVSVPCMFSIAGSSGFDNETSRESENLLDVLTHAGVNVLWLDNNSDSKGVAERVDYRSYREPGTNPVCDVECRDEGMLTELQEYINTHPRGDILIVLHQMGNHGPAYYKRYPASFEKFAPVCKSNQLQDCTEEEIGNAYDNAILYTDYFLSRVISLMKKNAEAFETAMFYVSDHGESLGENGMYLHGYPKFIAPEAQRHVAAIIWIGDNFDEIDTAALEGKRDSQFTHDNVFHTVLGFMEIQTSAYRSDLDMLTHLEEAH